MSSSLEKKRNSSLPNDLLLSCFARVSRLYYPTLSLVSKRFRSLLASPELYKARSLLGHTEHCLYVCFASYPRSLWYTLCLKPNQTLTNDNSGYVLATVPIPRSPQSCFSGLVAVGSDIYNIQEITSNVSILDCRTHTWRKAPSLPVMLLSLSASVLDGKIYVAGTSFKDGESYPDSLRNTVEVFDTKTQSWDAETIPCSETICDFYGSRSACIDGKFHVKAGKVVAYSSKESRWDLSTPKMGDFFITDSYCVIENVLYSASYGVLRWYDSKVRTWRHVKGGLPEFPCGAPIRLADYGGKMAVLWEVKIENDLYDLGQGGCGYKKIWCAEIALERLKIVGEIWGKVEWFDHVLTVPQSCHMVKVLAVTV
ncbi:unnamed protein product [Microthlaspi erraticum]|uniref:F-box domain-containing protein n=1 Tax=Microthlaspi erraticum TaxID=1685480 RepID=A0A6D2IDK2_9BRAS|nr:unnamed protein product [Microthlaspi erraticum]